MKDYILKWPPRIANLEVIQVLGIMNGIYPHKHKIIFTPSRSFHLKIYIANILSITMMNIK